MGAENTPTFQPIVAEVSWRSRMAGFMSVSRSSSAKEDKLALKRKEFYALVEQRPKERGRCCHFGAIAVFALAAALCGTALLLSTRLVAVAPSAPSFNQPLRLVVSWQSIHWRLSQAQCNERPTCGVTARRRHNEDHAKADLPPTAQWRRHQAHRTTCGVQLCSICRQENIVQVINP